MPVRIHSLSDMTLSPFYSSCTSTHQNHDVCICKEGRNECVCVGGCADLQGSACVHCCSFVVVVIFT